MHCIQPVGAEHVDVLLEGAETDWILFHEISGDRASRQSFETQGTGSGVKIEDTRVREIELEDAHPGFAYAIECGPDLRAGGRADSASAPAARDYPHLREARRGKREAGSGKRGAGSGNREPGSGRLFTLHSPGCPRFALANSS